MDVRANKSGCNDEPEEIDMLRDDCDLDALIDALTTLERVAAARTRRLLGEAPLPNADDDLENFDVDAFIGLKRQ